MIAVTPIERSAFGQGMHDRRVKLGYKIRYAARLADISVQRWSQLELGYERRTKDTKIVAANPSRATVRRVAHVLNWPLNEAYAAAGMHFDPDESPPPAEEHDRDRGTTFLELLRGLAPAQQDGLVTLMRTMQPPRNAADLAEDLPKAS